MPKLTNADRQTILYRLTLLRKSGLSFYPVFRSFDSSNFAGLT